MRHVTLVLGLLSLLLANCRNAPPPEPPADGGFVDLPGDLRFDLPGEQTVGLVDTSSDGAGLDSRQPDCAPPDAPFDMKLDAIKPDSAKPDSAKPDQAKPDSLKFDAKLPADTRLPDTHSSDLRPPDLQPAADTKIWPDTKVWPDTVPVIDKGPFCGNGVIDPGEHCDKLGPVMPYSCLGLGGHGGTLGCNSQCKFIYGCWFCGDGYLQGYEECEKYNQDGTIGPQYVGGKNTCQAWGFKGGLLSCGTSVANPGACLVQTAGCYN